mgnify:CR=1 FL=1
MTERKSLALVQIESMWEKDKVITDDKLIDFNRSIPDLHGRYHEIYNTECINRRKLEKEKNKLYMALKRYYGGISTREELTALGRAPWAYNKPLKSEMHEYIDSDTSWCELEDKLAMSEIKLKYLESILQTINRSSFIVKTQLDLIKFRDGEY